MSQPEKSSWLKVAAGCGIIGPVLAFTCILLAINSYPQFSWTSNALSDLGVVSGITAPLFNSGLIVSGLLCLAFAVFGLFTLLRERFVGKIGAFLFASSCLALVAIGIFTEDFTPIHYLVSVTFFVLTPISMLIIAGAFWAMNKLRIAAFTLIMALVGAAPWILLFAIRYVSGVAVPEAISSLAGSVWVVAFSVIMLKQASRSKTPH